MSLQGLQSVLQQQASGPIGAISISAATLQNANLQPSINFDSLVIIQDFR